MKRHTLFIYSLLLITLSAIDILPVQAQQQQQSHQYALYNYRNDGDFNAWLNIDIDSITYSCIDTLGIEHDDVVVQEVWTPDSLYRIPIEAIDSIGFWAPAPVMREGLFYLRDYHAVHTLAIDSLTLYFDISIRNDSLPAIGQTIVSETRVSPYEDGFAGKVLSVKTEQGKIIVVCERAEICDIFKKLVVVGKTSNNVDSSANARRKATIEETNIIEDIKVPDLEMSVLDGIFTIKSKAPKMTCGYYIYVDELIYSISADVYIRHEDLSFEVDFKYSQMAEAVSGISSQLKEHLLGEIKREYSKSTLEEYLKKGVKIPLKKGLINISLKLAPQIRIDGDVELNIVTKTSARQHLGFKAKGYTAAAIAKMYSPFPSLIPFNPLGSITHWDYNYVQDPVKSTSLSAKATCSAKFGFLIQLEANLVCEEVIHASVGVESGRKLSGTLQFNILDSDNPDMNFYDRIKDTKIELKNYAKLKGEIGASPLDFWALKGEVDYFDEVLGKYYIVPHFTKPELPVFQNGSWNNYHPLSLYSTISKDILFTCKNGLRIFDSAGTVVKELLIPEEYQYEVIWRYLPMEIDISDLEPDKTYRCYPVFAFWGSHYFKGGPYKEFSVPQPMSLANNIVTLQKNKAQWVGIDGGWGDYSAFVLDKSVCGAEIKQSGNNSFVQVVGLSNGSTTITVRDLRSNVTKMIIVKVTDEAVPQSTIAVNTKTLNFGDMEEGEVSSKRFTVSNTGNYELKFTVGRATAPFSIPEAGKEFALTAGGSKEFSVTCSGLKSGDGTKTQFIPISSDASNASADFGITLTAKCGVATTSAIKVEPTEIDFGGVEYLSAKTRELKVSNTGNKSLTFHVSYQGSEAFSISDSGKEYTLNPGDFKLFTITCQGMMQGSDATGEIKVVTTADNGNQSVRLTAKGAAPTTFTLEKNAIDVKVGSIAHVNILYGSESYGISNGNTDVVSVVIDTDGSDNTYGRVKLIAMEVGQSVVKLTDKKTNKTVNLTVTVKDDDSPYITFADAEVERICLSHWDTNHDGRLSKTEAAAVSNLNGTFMYNDDIKSFTEFRYFTGVTALDFDFYGCNQLRDIILPRNLKEIGWNTFYDCGELKSIHIPHSASLIDPLAFQWCNNLGSVTVSTANATYDSRGNCNAIIESETNKVNNGFYTTVIPSTVSAIGIDAFWGQDRLVELSIPSSVVEIGSGAFGFCDLKEVTIPASVVNIGGGAFGGCYKLKSITVASGNSVYDSREGCNAIINSHTNELMQGCQNTTIPTSVTSIAEGAFKWQYYLKNITIPDNVKSIGHYAFFYCSDLEQVYIPSSVSHIGSGAFGSCTDLSEVIVSPQNPKYDSRNNSNAIVETATNTLVHANKYSQIPDDITSIGDNALAGYNASSLILPEGVTTISTEAFRGSTLESLTLPSTLKELSSGVFWECEDLSDVTCYAKDVPYAGGFDWGDMTFHVYDATLHVPAKSVDNYRNAQYWQDFGNIVALPESTIKVEPTKIDFGTLDRGVSKTEHFTITNTGEGILSFHLDLSDNDVFEVSDAGKEFRLSSGELKEFTVTCHLPKDAEYSFSSAYLWIRSDASNADEYPFVSLDVSRLQNSTSISVTPAEIDFGVVGLGTNENKTITVTNTGSGTLTFTAYCDPSFSKYFEMSDSGVEFTLAPGATKNLTLTCHGIETGCRARSNIVIISNAEDNTKYVRLSVVGTDSEPLVETGSLNLSVGEGKTLAVRTEDFDFVNCNPEIVKATRGGSTSGGGGGELGDYDFNSSYFFGTGHLVVEALAAGVATVKITDKATGKEDILTVTVSSSSTNVTAEAIDLGLPSGTKWASFNVGANKAEEAGGYYAWGETEEKTVYNSGSYQYSKDKVIDIGRNISGTNYDVAHVKWGDDWCMPTKEEFSELWNNCTHSWSTVNGVKGMKFTASNGNSIFLPASGRKLDSEVYDNQENGFYRTATSSASIYSSGGLSIPEYFALEEPEFIDIFSVDGVSVRPVMHPISVPTGSFVASTSEIDFDLVELGTDKTKTFKVFNTTNENITFKVSCDGTMSRYFEISDNEKEFTLAPNTTKEYVVISHGMPTGYEASTTLIINSNENSQKQKVILKAYGWDRLIDKTEVVMNVGDKITLPIMTDNYSMPTNEYWNIVSVSKGGGTNTTKGGRPGYGGHVYSSTGNLQLEAVGEGKASLRIKDETSGRYVYITVTVKPGLNTSAKAVDLGLPSGTKWASCNVGATKPEELGAYYAWGETETKSSFNWNNYVHSDGSKNTSHDIGSDISGTEYDVAHVKWGKEWRMPTRDQCKELIDNCTMEQTTINGKDGYRFTGPNGNSVFLPIADNLPNGMGHAYWSSTAYADDHARTLRLTESEATITGWPRYDGFSVRPVIKGTPPALTPSR
jgi:hypothetical protein